VLQEVPPDSFGTQPPPLQKSVAMQSPSPAQLDLQAVGPQM
jgi:hypothetical protein